MSTVESDIRCPNCKFCEAAYFFDNRNLDEFVSCPRCGFWQERDLKTGVERNGGGLGSVRMLFAKISQTGHLRGRMTLRKRMLRFRRAIASPKVIKLEFTVRLRGKWQTVVAKSPKQLRKRERHFFKTAVQYVELGAGLSMMEPLYAPKTPVTADDDIAF